MSLWHKLALVVLGGGIGSGLRWAVSEWTLQRFGPAFPWGTLFVNISGSLLMGIVMGVITARSQGVWGSSEELPWKFLLCSGLIGGYTTFSALAWEGLRQLESADYARAALNLIATLGIGLVAVWLGAQLGRAI